MTMRGINGLSADLDRIAEPLLRRNPEAVLDIALRITRDSYSHDADITPPIEAYRSRHAHLHVEQLSSELARKADECDEAYGRLEEEGNLVQSRASFKKMCILNGLSRLFATSSITPEIVDDIVYDLGHGSPDIDGFVEIMTEAVKSFAGGQ
jgi:hypothetical protein